MAGEGNRFSQQGYTLPKPLVPVSGEPMILKVIRDLPKAEKWIFIIREEHIVYRIDKVIGKILPRAVFLVDPKPIGQAGSCLIAEKYLDNTSANHRCRSRLRLPQPYLRPRSY